MKTSGIKRAGIWFFLIFLGTLSCGGSGGGTEVTNPPDVFETDSPVDLPAPIAKGINGIDPTSAVFDASGATAKIAGILTAETIDNVEATVALIIDGKTVETSKTSGGVFSFEITTTQAKKELTLVVLGTGENAGSVSQPVVVTITAEGTAQVYATNTGVILQESIAVSETGLVAFLAETSDGSPFVGTVPINGGSPSILNNTITNRIEPVDYDSDVGLWAIDSTNSVLHYIHSDGSLESEGFDAGLAFTAGTRIFTIGPDGLWYVANRLVSGSVVGVLFSFEFVDEEVTFVLSNPDQPTILDFDFDWLSNSSGIAIRKFGETDFRVQLYSDLDLMKAGDKEALTITTLSTSTRFLGNPAVDDLNGNRFVYECTDESGNIDLCLGDLLGNVSTVVDGNVAHVQMSPDGNYVVYEETSQGGGDSCEGRIQRYILSTETTEDLATGCFPYLHPANPDLIAYLSPLKDKLQVGVVNLENVN